jgi:hypothetical protein
MTSVPLTDLDSFRVGFGTVKSLLTDMIAIFDPSDNDIDAVSYTPVLTGSGGMSWAATSSSGLYIRIGRLICVAVDCTGVVGGTPDFLLYASLPFSPIVGNDIIFGHINSNSQSTPPFKRFAGNYDASLFQFRREDFAVWTAGSTRCIGSGFYFLD